MKTLTSIACSLALAASCGDNLKGSEPGRDASPDATSFPAAPTLGAQIERMGRPAINTVLTAAFEPPGAGATAKKDAYNTASDPAMWLTTPVAAGRTVLAEFAVNLAIIDVLDKGDARINPNGCKNQILYNQLPQGGGTPAANSYFTLAGFLADDMLYVDTNKTTCTRYLSLESEAAGSGSPHSQCGGRAPTHDVIDTSYSMLAAGLKGFTLPPDLTPLYGDGVDAHADVSDTVFPYFGAPH